jgi:hypothetical protein
MSNKVWTDEELRLFASVVFSASYLHETKRSKEYIAILKMNVPLAMKWARKDYNGEMRSKENMELCQRFYSFMAEKGFRFTTPLLDGCHGATFRAFTWKRDLLLYLGLAVEVS